MVRALGITLFQFRPFKAVDAYDGSLEYIKSSLANCKLEHPKKGWTVDTAGSSRSASAVLYWNVGHSVQEPRLDPPFKEGDIITTMPAFRKVEDDKFVLADAMTEVGDRQGDVPDMEFTVQAVREQTFKGVLHHYEVILV